MTDIEFSSDITVKLRKVWGTDRDVPETARVSSKGWDDFDDDDLIFHEDEVALTDGDVNLINMLSENHHTSPFEHMGASFYLHVPIFVMREWMRHRTQSYNEESGRWRVLEGRFYIPELIRPVVQVGRTGEYSFVPDQMLAKVSRESHKRANKVAWNEYQFQLNEGIAKEVARMSLPVNIYTRVIVSANYLNWVKFLKLRAHPAAMHEIRHAAYDVKDALHKHFPVSTAAWFKGDE